MVLYACFSGYIPSSTLDSQKQHGTARWTVSSWQLQIKQNNTKISPKCSIFALTIHFSAFLQPLGPSPYHTRAPRRAWQTPLASSSKAGSEKVFAAPKVQTHKKLHLSLGETMLGRRFERQWEDESFTPHHLALSACKQGALVSIFPLLVSKVAVKGQ